MSFTASSVILGALQLLGQYKADRTTLGVESTAGLIFLNALTLELENYGGFLWKRSVAFLFVEKEVLSYTISSSSANCSETYTTTRLSAAAASGATTITVEDATVVTDTYNILIDLGDGTYHSTTVNGSPSGSTVTLTTGLSAAAADNARIFVFQTKLSAPVRTFECGVRAYATSTDHYTDTGQDMKSIDDWWFRESNKSNNPSNQGIAYQPLISTGTIFTCGQRNTSQVNVVYFSFQKAITVAASAASNMDFPDRWQLTLMFLLAYMWSPMFTVTQAQFTMIQSTAMYLLSKAMSGDSQTASFIPITNNVGRNI